jgi:hypothetical protein
MTVRNNRKAAATSPVAGIAGFTPEQAATLRTGVNAAMVAGKKIKEGRIAQGNATDILIAGMSNAALLSHRFEFQARDKKGNVVETKQASLYDYARKAAPFYIAGKEQRARISGFRASVLAFAAGVNDASTPAADSVWALIKGKVLPVAIALADNTITATMAGNKLALTGGNGSSVAGGLFDAAKKSTSALVAKVTAKGTNKPPVEKAKGKVAAPAKVALDTEAAMRAALAYLRKVAAGDEAISNKRISLLKGIAKAAGDIIAQEAASKA